MFNVKLDPDLGSDHLSIRFEIDLGYIPDPALNSLSNHFTFNFKKTNFEAINHDTIKYIKLNKLTDDDNINSESSSMFLQAFTKIVNKNLNKRKIQYYSHSLPPDILALIKIKRRHYREFRDNPNPELKNRLNKDIQERVRTYRSTRWAMACQSLNYKRNSVFWKDINKMTNYKQSPNPKRLEFHDLPCFTNKDRAQIFASYFRDFYQDTENPLFDQNYRDAVNNWYVMIMISADSFPQSILIQTTAP